MIFWTIVAMLATYRASRMIALEDGPFDIFSRLQTWAGGNTNWVGRGLGCVLCVSFWLSLPAALLVGVSNGASFVLLWFGIAGGTAVLHRLFG